MVTSADFNEEVGAYIIDLKAVRQNPPLEVTAQEIVSKISEFEIEKLFDRLLDTVWGHVNMYTLHTHKGVFIELTTKEETYVK